MQHRRIHRQKSDGTLRMLFDCPLTDAGDGFVDRISGVAGTNPQNFVFSAGGARPIAVTMPAVSGVWNGMLSAQNNCTIEFEIFNHTNSTQGHQMGFTTGISQILFNQNGWGGTNWYVTTWDALGWIDVDWSVNIGTNQGITRPPLNQWSTIKLVQENRDGVSYFRFYVNDVLTSETSRSQIPLGNRFQLMHNQTGNSWSNYSIRNVKIYEIE